jgi:hypothetical protein
MKKNLINPLYYNLYAIRISFSGNSLKNNHLKKLLLFVLITTSFVSCKTTNYSGQAVAPTVTMNYNIEIDLEIDKSKTLQATSTTSVYFGVFKSQDTFYSDALTSNGGIGELEKKAATYKALKGTPYDILVNPKYIIEVQKSLFIKKVTATVAGYGAKVKIK